jgi:hypothetical protein
MQLVMVSFNSLCSLYLLEQFESTFIRKVVNKLVSYSYPFTGTHRPLGFQKFEAPRILRQLAHEGGKVVRPTHQATFTPREDPWYSFLLEVELTQGHSAPGRIKSMKNLKDPIGNQTATFRFGT